MWRSPDDKAQALQRSGLRRVHLKMQYNPVDADGEELAERIRREVYLATLGDHSKWHSVSSLEEQFSTHFHDVQDALRYAVIAGWIEATGDPITRIRLLPASITPV